MKKITLATVTALTLLSTAAMAQGYAVGLTGGTMGLGVEATTDLTRNINVRALAAGFTYSKDGTSGTNINYQGTAKLLNAGVILDYYPFENGLRLSAGGIYNGTKVTLDGQPNAGGTYTINGTTYSAADVGTVSGEAKYQKIMPYVGIGFANPIKGSSFTFGCDVGAMFGKATTTLTASNPTNDATLAANVAAEEVKLQDEANKLSFYPVIQFNVAYRF